jgi:hypothetical protein
MSHEAISMHMSLRVIAALPDPQQEHTGAYSPARSG